MGHCLTDLSKLCYSEIYRTTMLIVEVRLIEVSELYRFGFEGGVSRVGLPVM